MKVITDLKQAFLLFIIYTASTFAQGNAKFRVVLDAGHGGKDYGAIYYGYVEKNIALNVALKVGKILSDNATDVIYTRKSDVFLGLDERPAIANRAEADIFVSIHCNGEPKKAAYGTETFVIGSTKNASNLEVAKQENNVISLEKDYKTKYAGFSPGVPETLSGTPAQQEAATGRAIDLASKIQDGFVTTLKRKSRGVKQGPLWLLHKTTMPSVLVELGFISFQEEGTYLDSEEGQNELAKSIAKAILAYKKEYFVAGTKTFTPEAVAEAAQPEAEPVKAPPAKTPPAKAQPVKVKEPEPAVAAADKTTANVVFKVQIAASGKKLDLVPANFNGLTDISKDDSGAVIKYFYGSTAQYSAAKTLLEQAKAKGFTSAFMVAFKDGKKIPLQEALK